MRDTKPLEKEALNLIHYKLQKFGYQYAELSFDEDGVDGIIYNDVHNLKKILRFQAKGRSIITNSSNVKIRKEYLLEQLICFVYIVTDNDVKNYLNQKFGITVAIVDGVFVNEAGETNSYYADNKVTLIPTGTLGRTIYGTTPEEADAIFGSGKLDTQIVNTGVAITSMAKEDPVTVEVKVSQLGMPSFDKVDECFFATVY